MLTKNGKSILSINIILNLLQIFMKSPIIFLAGLLFAASAFSAQYDYYWSGASGNSNSASNWRTPDEASGATAAFAAVNETNKTKALSVYLNSDTTAFPEIWYQTSLGTALAGESYVNQIVNNSTRENLKYSPTSTTWELFMTGGSTLTDRVVNIAKMVQDSATISMRLRRGSGAAFLVLKIAEVEILQKGMELGSTSYKVVPEIGKLTMAGGTTLAVYSETGTKFTGDVTLGSSTISLTNTAGEGNITHFSNAASTLKINDSASVTLASSTDVVIDSALSLGTSATFNLNNSVFGTTASIASATFLRGAKFNTNSNTTATITGNLSATDSSTAVTLSVASGKMIVRGTVEKGTGGNALIFGATTGKAAVYEVGGVNGGASSASNANRLATDYSTANMKNIELLIKGTGAAGSVFKYSGRVHDMAETAKNIAESTTSKLSITMDAAGYTQYFAGQNYIRGVTTVKNGTLFLSSNNAKGGGDVWYFADVSLEGGFFGACGAATASNVVPEAGIIKAINLDWSAGVMLFDLSKTVCDKIELSGDFTGTGTQHKFIFTCLDDVDLGGKSFDLVSWNGNTTFNESDFSAEFDGDFTAKFTQEAGKLSIMFTAIPEPSTYAAIFGILALGFAAYRRKSK